METKHTHQSVRLSLTVFISLFITFNLCLVKVEGMSVITGDYSIGLSVSTILMIGILFILMSGKMDFPMLIVLLVLLSIVVGAAAAAKQPQRKVMYVEVGYPEPVPLDSCVNKDKNRVLDANDDNVFKINNTLIYFGDYTDIEISNCIRQIHFEEEKGYIKLNLDEIANIAVKLLTIMKDEARYNAIVQERIEKYRTYLKKAKELEKQRKEVEQLLADANLEVQVQVEAKEEKEKEEMEQQEEEETEQSIEDEEQEQKLQLNKIQSNCKLSVLFGIDSCKDAKEMKKSRKVLEKCEKVTMDASDIAEVQLYVENIANSNGNVKRNAALTLLEYYLKTLDSGDSVTLCRIKMFIEYLKVKYPNQYIFVKYIVANQEEGMTRMYKQMESSRFTTRLIEWVQLSTWDRLSFKRVVTVAITILASMVLMPMLLNKQALKHIDFIFLVLVAIGALIVCF